MTSPSVGPRDDHDAAPQDWSPTERMQFVLDARDLGDQEARRAASPARRSPRAHLPELYADRLRRVFADDVLQCPCGGRRSVIAVVTDPAIARTLLGALGLAHEPGVFAPARAPPQAELDWDDAS